MDIEFALTEEGKLLAYPDSKLNVVEFSDGRWILLRGTFGDWLDSRPITAEEAARITSGVMPA